MCQTLHCRGGSACTMAHLDMGLCNGDVLVEGYSLSPVWVPAAVLWGSVKLGCLLKAVPLDASKLFNRVAIAMKWFFKQKSPLGLLNQM